MRKILIDAVAALLLLLSLTVSGEALAFQGSMGSWDGFTQAAADALYLPFTGGTLSGDLTLDADLTTSTGVFNSTVADGVAGLVIDIVNPHATGDLLCVKEAGGTCVFNILPTGNSEMNGLTVRNVLAANSQIYNVTGTSTCTDSGDEVCIKDDIKIDGILFTEETTTPTAVPNYGAWYTKADDKPYFQSGAGVELELMTNGSFNAMAYDEENDEAFVVTVDGEWESYHVADGADGPITGDGLSGWTLDVGGSGISHAITAIADAGGGDITVTTGDAHLLEVGDIVSQSNHADAAYEGIFEVLTVPSGTTYTVTAVYTATDTGTMDQAFTLEAGVGAAGRYSVSWGASATSAVNNEVFDYGIFLNGDGAAATPSKGSAVRRKFGIASDFGDFGRTFQVTIADGDKLSFGLMNIGANGNLIIRYLTLTLSRL